MCFSLLVAAAQQTWHLVIPAAQRTIANIRAVPGSSSRPVLGPRSALPPFDKAIRRFPATRLRTGARQPGCVNASRDAVRGRIARRVSPC